MKRNKAKKMKYQITIQQRLFFDIDIHKQSSCL